MQLTPWQFKTSAGFYLKGMRSEPSGKPLLHVLHGNGYCALMYQPMLQPLLSHVDLFLSDVQGHGQSEHGDAFVGWNASAEYAEQALQAHLPLYGDVPIYAIGHSFGGVLTALLHSQQNSPFQAVLLLDPVLFTPMMLRAMQLLDWLGLYRHNPLAKRAIKRRNHFADTTQAWQYFHQRGMFKGWHDDALDAYIQHALQPVADGLVLRCQPSREADVFASFPRRLWSLMQQMQHPLKLVYGQQSYPFVGAAANHLQRMCPQVEVSSVAGGHCFMQERPAQTAELIVQWLQQQQQSN
jgi:pimeloyl-ACP methyl ester carboxylesterase